MKKNVTAVLAVIGWFAVITQYVLMLENRAASIPETTIRFFSFFTILTNLLVAVYFTYLFFMSKANPGFRENSGTLTAITIYITMVGLVYQVALRHVWQPQGLQLVVDELLHSVMPALVIIFWCFYGTTKPIKYSQITSWSIYPLAYLTYILVRGSFSNFYPYPFVDVSNLGIAKALSNAAVLLFLFVVLSATTIAIVKAKTGIIGSNEPHH